MKIFNSLLQQEVAGTGIPKRIPADTVLFEENSYARSIPIVLSGSIKILRRDEEGKEMLLYYIRPGETCIMSFLAGIHENTGKVRGVVEEDAEILWIPMSKASAWIKDFPEWTTYIFKLYHQRFEELLSVVNAIAFQQLDQRILGLLQQKATVYKSREIRITHQLLAEELGTTREVVSRLLKQMEKQNLITLGRNKIILSA